jgi:glycosyltransferase involved in cell wall biosynthesis
MSGHDPSLPVLLFYREPEKDRYLPLDRYALRLVRPLYRRLTGRQSTTGFRVWFESLVKALRLAGVEVAINDSALARRHPRHPVGLVGYPAVLESFSLPNPTVLGPGLYDHPKVAPRLFDDPRHRAYLVTCRWMHDLFGRYYPGRLHLWHGGIDLVEWPDTRQHAKSIDVLVYDKLRWDRPLRERELLEPLLAELRRRGLSHQVVRYGRYQQADYRRLLAQSRSMLFLCEHETQGMAYQEALASNVPVLAWENGFWLDPRREQYEAEPVPASAVPYFSEECGRRFVGAEDFPAVLEAFLARATDFEPRRFVERELSLGESARRYLEVYRGI